jgi:agmatine deiminase
MTAHNAAAASDGFVLPEGFTPAGAGFRMPAEWAPHRATWISWPHRDVSWPGKLVFAEQCVARWVREISRARAGAKLPAEQVEINCLSEDHALHVERFLNFFDVAWERVRLHVIPTNDIWIRDYGPLFVNRPAAVAAKAADGLGTQGLVKFTFDAWGGKGEAYYGQSFGLDGATPLRIAERLNKPAFPVDLVAEGGGLEVNGEGALLTTVNCFVERRDNAGRSAAEKRKGIEKQLADALGVDHFLWLDGVDFEGDDTEGHIDNLARFVGPKTILTVLATDKTDPLYEPLKKNLKQVEKLRDKDGKPYEVVTIPMPRPLHLRVTRFGERALLRYPASYANFYIGNQAVLVPTYSDPNDWRALEAIEKIFPGREVVGIDCSEYILGCGAIHCSTQQEPLAP